MRSLDRLVRRSWLGRRIGWLRKASPDTYVRLRGIYERAVGRGGAQGPSRYQRNALEEFLREAGPRLLEQGVLEVGSDVEGRVLRALAARGASRITGINPALDVLAVETLNRALPERVSVESVDIRNSGFASESFGAIFSVAVFEHLLDLDTCLQEMHRLLLPGGIVFAAFGPIWGSGLGHHVFAEVDGVQLRHWDPRLNPIDNHAHLLLAPEAMRQRIAAVRAGALADAAVHWIYRGDDLNRLFYEDYVRAFERSRFEIVRLTPERDHVPESRLAELREAHPGYRAFDVRNAEVVLRRPA